MVSRLYSLIIGGKFIYCVYSFYKVVTHLHHNCIRKWEGDSNIELYSTWLLVLVASDQVTSTKIKNQE